MFTNRIGSQAPAPFIPSGAHHLARVLWTTDLRSSLVAEIFADRGPAPVKRQS